MPTTLYRNGHVRTPEHPAATALLVRDDRVSWLGVAADAPGAADREVDLAGGLLTPAFVDAHVHTTSTGLALVGLDLTGAADLSECLRRVEDACRRAAGRVVYGHGWDETTWPENRPPTREELDRASYGGVVYLSRIDVHSAVVSSALMAAVPEGRSQPGWSDTGHMTRDAHHTVRHVARESITSPQRQQYQLAAMRHAASLGIGSFHELAGPDISSEADLRALQQLCHENPDLPEVLTYWGELGPHGISRAKALGTLGAAGDLFADGAIGSHTAFLNAPYADADTCGFGYLTAASVRDHVIGCTEEGLQAGFHAIGDAAVDTIVAGLHEAEDRLGAQRLRAARHRLEHVEMVSPEAIATLARLGVVASVQPSFDRLWGGKSGMYAERLGGNRAGRLNPFADLLSAGVILALGSDSPVTGLDPWGSVRAAVNHHTPGSGIAAVAAFAGHTVGGWRAAGHDDKGELRIGGEATLAVWDPSSYDGLDPASGLPALEGPLPRCRETVVRGQVIFASG